MKCCHAVVEIHIIACEMLSNIENRNWNEIFKGGQNELCQWGHWSRFDKFWRDDGPTTGSLLCASSHQSNIESLCGSHNLCDICWGYCNVAQSLDWVKLKDWHLIQCGQTVIAAHPIPRNTLWEDRSGAICWKRWWNRKGLWFEAALLSTWMATSYIGRPEMFHWFTSNLLPTCEKKSQRMPPIRKQKVKHWWIYNIQNCTVMHNTRWSCGIFRILCKQFWWWPSELSQIAWPAVDSGSIFPGPNANMKVNGLVVPCVMQMSFQALELRKKNILPKLIDLLRDRRDRFVFLPWEVTTVKMIKAARHSNEPLKWSWCTLPDSSKCQVPLLQSLGRAQLWANALGVCLKIRRFN